MEVMVRLGTLAIAQILKGKVGQLFYLLPTIEAELLSRLRPVNVTSFQG